MKKIKITIELEADEGFYDKQMLKLKENIEKGMAQKALSEGGAKNLTMKFEEEEITNT